MWVLSPTTRLRVPIVLAVLLACRAGWADTTADIAAAKRLFSEATVLRSAGNFEGAVSKLKSAILIKETVGLRFHLAYCEARLGRLLDAKTDYDRADQLIREGASAPDVTPLLDRARADLAERIPSVRIKAGAGTAGMVVTVDGAPVADLSQPISLDPGTHAISARAPGHEPFDLSLTLSEGDDRVVDVALRSTAAPAPPPTRPTRKSVARDTHGTGFGAREGVLVTEAVLALAGTALGATYLVKRASATQRAEAAARQLPPDSSACEDPSSGSAGPCSSLKDALEERHDDGIIATWAFVGGGMSAAAFAVTWFSWPSGTAPRSAATRLTPLPRGFVLSGYF